MTQPRHEYTLEQVLERVGRRLGGNDAELGSNYMAQNLHALFELCQQQRLLIRQWEEFCQMKCPGCPAIAELVRAMDEEPSERAQDG